MCLTKSFGQHFDIVCILNVTDNSYEFDSFKFKHENQFEEFSQDSYSGILSQLWQKLFGNFDEIDLKQQLQKSFEDFYIECTIEHT
jgi:hypothetical protein